MKLREIYVNEFSESSALEFRHQVISLSNRFPKDPVRIYIDSHGGDLEALASMVATLKQIPNEVHTLAIGKAMSAGAFLLSYGDQRYCDPRAVIMFHSIQLSNLPDMDMEDLKMNAKEFERLNRFWLTLFGKNCGMSYRDLQEIFKEKGKEVYLTAKQAHNLGIVDYIGLPKINPQVYMLPKDMQDEKDED